jgi:hypothetical protein
MAIVGFSFTKIVAERKPVGEQAVNIESNAAVVNIGEMPVIDPKKTVIKFDFNFIVKYEPDAGKIELEGELIELFDKDFGVKVIEHWNAEKNVHPEIMQEVFNNILGRSNVQSIVLSRDMSLPSPIQMPRVDVRPAEKHAKAESKSEAKAESKLEKGKK